MTRDELAEKLRGTLPGQGVRIPYPIFEMIFPPGHLDDVAKMDAYEFARQLGLKIENRPDNQSVWFYRDPAD